MMKLVAAADLVIYQTSLYVSLVVVIYTQVRRVGAVSAMLHSKLARARCLGGRGGRLVVPSLLLLMVGQLDVCPE